MEYLSNHKNKTINHTKASKGFVALYAMLIATIILIMVVSTTGTAYKETLLASSVRESEQAFYATDTGVECGLYLDRIENIFSLGVLATSCGDLDIDIESATETIFIFDIEISTDACAKVEVNKDFIEEGISFTQVTSRGYNASCEEIADVGSKRVVERKLDVRYPNPVIIPPPPMDGIGDPVL